MPAAHASHISGSAKRIFINTELGCRSSCSYCYLPAEGFPIGAKASETIRISASEALRAVYADSRVIRGPNGTVFSLGCFSECWDPRNRFETEELIEGLLSLGNPIQMATKREIEQGHLSQVASGRRWQGQISVYLSSATISAWDRYEGGTTAPSRRFRGFLECAHHQIPAFLYIKPVIPGITIGDAVAYGDVMRRFGVPAVVGDRFIEGSAGVLSPISTHLVVAEHPDVEMLRKLLEPHGKVYAASNDARLDIGGGSAWT